MQGRAIQPLGFIRIPLSSHDGLAMRETRNGPHDRRSPEDYGKFPMDDLPSKDKHHPQHQAGEERADMVKQLSARRTSE